MDLQAFSFSWPADGDTATVTMPEAMTIDDYTVTYGFEDLATGDAATILTFPAVGKTTTEFDVEAASSLLMGTVIGFTVRTRA